MNSNVSLFIGALVVFNPATAWAVAVDTFDEVPSIVQSLNPQTDSPESPEYTIGGLRDLVGNVFLLGLDLKETAVEWGVDLSSLDAEPKVVLSENGADTELD